mmetsp:Transcript_501/g.798  ORF Transcript_501/g.798 Transcript_501/m.798 type:complete len:126 (-) Transcript_501:91-468(-)
MALSCQTQCGKPCLPSFGAAFRFSLSPPASLRAHSCPLAGAHHLLAGLIPQLSPSPSLAGGAVRLGVLRMASGFSSDGEPSLSRAGLLLPRGAGIGFPSPSSPLFSATFCLSQACLNGGGIRVWL